MANIKSNIKTVRKTKKRTLRNKIINTSLKNVIKNARANQNADNYKLACKKLDSACAKGVIHKNKVNRLKSRLAKKNAIEKK